jgi:hypothetical protein
LEEGACAFFMGWDAFVLALRCFLGGALPTFGCLADSDSLNLHSSFVGVVRVSSPSATISSFALVAALDPFGIRAGLVCHFDAFGFG